MFSHWYRFFIFLFLCGFHNVYGFTCRIERAAILKFIPFLKMHDVVVIDNSLTQSVLCIDFTPSSPRNLVKLVLGKNIPAEIRIRKLPAWSIDEWYKSPCVSIYDIDDMDLREIINKVVDEWPIEMNLYNHNCKHFGEHLIAKLPKCYC